jgi:hypothetical protein
MKKASLLLFATIAAATTALLLPQARGEVLFEGTPTLAQFVLNFGAVASGDAVNVDTTDSDETWRTWLVSRPEAIAFEPGKRYRVSWDFEVQKNKGPETHYYYYFQSADDQNSRKGNGKWLAKDGESGQMEVTATLGDVGGYVFALGISKGGAVAIKNLKIEEVPPPKLDKGFLYQGAMENDGRLRFSPQAKIVEGGLVVSTTSKRWNNIFSTSPQELPLLPGHTYRISYSYSVENAGEEARMNQSLTTADSEKKENFHWDSWEIAPGQSGVKEVELQITEPGCFFAVHDHGGSTVRIENFSIEDLGKQ